MPDFEIIVVSGALLVSLATNVLLVRHHERAIDNLLNRIHTSPKLEMIHSPSAPVAAPPSEKLYIPEHVGGDDDWNNYRGEPADEGDES